MFTKAYELYSLFWGLNMKLIQTDDLKKIDDNALNKQDQEGILAEENENNDKEEKDEPEKKKSLGGKLGDLVRKVIDCCIE
jgi:nitrogen fixation-related uncharacterized protein